MDRGEKLPIKMLSDRLLVRIPSADGERRSTGGILIPATAQVSKRLVWAEVVALGPALPLASRAARRTVACKAAWSISFMMIRVRRSWSARRPSSSSPT